MATSPPRFQKPRVPPPAPITAPRAPSVRRPVTPVPSASLLTAPSPLFVVLLSVILGPILLFVAAAALSPGVLAIVILLGLIPAVIARRKGRSLALWWFYGATLFIVALPHALVLKHDLGAVEARQVADGMKKCAFCAEMIKPDAAVCRYCGREVTGPAPSSAPATREGGHVGSLKE